MATEELVNHNHTAGRGHPNLGGHDAHVGKEVAIGMRGGRSFDKALAESQHYQLHRGEIATLPKRARRELHRHILGIANAHERAQGYPGHAFAAEEFYNKAHSSESGQFTHPGQAAAIAEGKAAVKRIAPGPPKKGGKAAVKKKDTSNWHRDRIIADQLAKLRGGAKASKGASKGTGAKAIGKQRAPSKVSSKTPKGATIKIPKPKAVKASAAYEAVEEFYNHMHSPADGKFTGAGTGGGGVTHTKHREPTTRVANPGNQPWRSIGLLPSSLAKGEAKTRKYHDLQDMKEARRTKNANVPVITAAEARGDSRPVSHEEFQRLAAVGRAQLDAMRSGSSPTTGLNARWETIKSETYAKAQKSWGGATIDSHTGVEVPQGANKYALTVKGSGVNTVSVPEGASAAEFNAAMDKAKAKFGSVLERAGHHLGVFHDDATHRIDIDPVIVTANHADVETIGAATHAIGGAYNFADGNGYFPPHVVNLNVERFVEEFVEEFRAGRSPYAGNPKSIGGRSPSLKWPHLYDILQAKGYDKESSAAISNSRVWARKGGQLGGLPWAKADNPKALKAVLKKTEAKHGKKA